MLPAEPIPAPGFNLVSGKRNPPAGDRQYTVQFRTNVEGMGYVDRARTYTASQLVWVHSDPPSAWDVVAVK